MQKNEKWKGAFLFNNGQFIQAMSELINIKGQYFVINCYWIQLDCFIRDIYNYIVLLTMNILFLLSQRATSPEEHLNRPNYTDPCIHDCIKPKVKKKQKLKRQKIIYEYCVNIYFVINFLLWAHHLLSFYYLSEIN